MTAVVVEVTNLRKRYREREAVRDVSFAVRRGEVFGIAGRNGAGKTTTVECVLGLRTPDGGAVRVLGVDPGRERARVARKLGAQLQECELPEKIRVGEAAALYASFHEHPADWRALLDRVGLADRLRTPVKKLSGGQRQRLFIALALVGDPEVVVFDELTTGLDPQARRDIWELVEDVRARGVTVLLVTHLMEEAERLCDRVAVIDRGRVLALDTPAGLVAGADVPARVVFHAQGPLDEHRLTELPQVIGVRRSGARVEVTGRGDLGPAVLGALAGAGAGVTDLLTHRPTLDDAFLAMTAVELKLFLREPPVLIFGVATPVLLLVIFGSIPAMRVANPEFGGRSFVQIYLPAVLSMSVATLSLSGLTQILGSYRERGVLRRLAATPVSPAAVLIAQLVVHLVTALVTLVALLAIGRLAFGIPLPANPLGFAVSYLLAAVGTLALGLLIAALAPTARIAAGIGAACFFPLVFLAGLWTPGPMMPALFRRIADYTPLGAGSQALAATWQGQWPSALHLVVLAGLAVLLTGLAARTFRWS